MVDDTPDDLVFELHAGALWPDHPYGYSILGTRDTVKRAQAADLRRAARRGVSSRADRVIAAAGNVDARRLLEVLERDGLVRRASGVQRAPLPPRRHARGARGVAHVKRERDIAQTHIVLGTDTLPHRRSAALSPCRRWSNAAGRRHVEPAVPAGARGARPRVHRVFVYNQFYQDTGQHGVYLGDAAGEADAALRRDPAGDADAWRPAGWPTTNSPTGKQPAARGSSCCRWRARGVAHVAGGRSSRCIDEPYRPLDATAGGDRRGHAGAGRARSAAEFLDPTQTCRL